MFAPHSTEAGRRTLLRKQQRIAQRLLERLDPSLTPHEARSIWDNIRMELTSAWQTEELPRARLTVADEREQILFYLVEILYRVVPAFYEEIAQALEKVYGATAGALRVPAILHFGSWAGGDMDGNPDVHAKSIRETLARQQQVIVNAYFQECQELAQRLSQSASRVPVSAELAKRLEQYVTLLPGARAITPARHDRMPYRVFLAQIGERLRGAFDGRASGYQQARQFRDDIALIAASLKANKGTNAGLFYVERLLRRIDTFGFHLATLDVRQHAAVLHEVLAQGLDDPQWLARSRRERRDRLAQALEKDRGPLVELDALGKRTLAVFDAIMQGRHRYGADAIGYFIVSGAAGADDMLAALLLAHWAQAYDKHTGEVALDIAPQFETEESLARLRRDPARSCSPTRSTGATWKRAAVRQCVLIGYSDSNKEAGACASRVAHPPGAGADRARAGRGRGAARVVPCARRQRCARRRPHRGDRQGRPGGRGRRRAAHPRAGLDRQAGLRPAPDRDAHAGACLQRPEPRHRRGARRPGRGRLAQRTWSSRSAWRARAATPTAAWSTRPRSSTSSSRR